MTAAVCSQPGCPNLRPCPVHGRTSSRNHYGATRQSRGYDRAYELRRVDLLVGSPPCYWGCGRRATTADHRIPLAHGGNPADLVPSCARCNYARGARVAREMTA